MREISLEGGEITVLKAIGFGGTNVTGETLVERLPSLETAELIDTLQGLMMFGYVVADRQSFHEIEDLNRTTFHVNSGYSKDLRAAIDPTRRPKETRRRRRQ
jgi:hypothetical protein